jgi:hypothetical protein
MLSSTIVIKYLLIVVYIHSRYEYSFWVQNCQREKCGLLIRTQLSFGVLLRTRIYFIFGKYTISYSFHLTKTLANNLLVCIDSCWFIMCQISLLWLTICLFFFIAFLIRTSNTLLGTDERTSRGCGCGCMSHKYSNHTHTHSSIQLTNPSSTLEYISHCMNRYQQNGCS